MSKSVKLKINNLFHKTKSLDKENKDGEKHTFKDATSYGDGELASPGPSLPSSPGLVSPVSPLDGPLHRSPASEKKKKKKRFLSLQLKKKGSTEEGRINDPLFYNGADELHSFTSNMSFDQPSVKTEYSTTTDRDATSMISYDMSAFNSLSPNKSRNKDF